MLKETRLSLQHRLLARSAGTCLACTGCAQCTGMPGTLWQGTVQGGLKRWSCTGAAPSRWPLPNTRPTVLALTALRTVTVTGTDPVQQLIIVLAFDKPSPP